MKINKNLLTLLVIGAWAVPQFLLAPGEEFNPDEWTSVEKPSQDQGPEMQKLENIAKLKQEINNHVSPVKKGLSARDKFAFNKPESAEQSGTQGIFARARNAINKSWLNTAFETHATNAGTGGLYLGKAYEDQFANLDDADQKDLANNWQKNHNKNTADRLVANEQGYHNSMNNLKYGDQAKTFAEIKNIENAIKKNNDQIEKLQRQPKNALSAKLNETTIASLQAENAAKRTEIEKKLTIIRDAIQRRDAAYDTKGNDILTEHQIKNENFIDFFNRLAKSKIAGRALQPAALPAAETPGEAQTFEESRTEETPVAETPEETPAVVAAETPPRSPHRNASFGIPAYEAPAFTPVAKATPTDFENILKNFYDKPAETSSQYEPLPAPLALNAEDLSQMTTQQVREESAILLKQYGKDNPIYRKYRDELVRRVRQARSEV